jgi:lysozyme
MTFSPNGFALLESFEGFSPAIYLDNGHPCIGYGCDLTPEEAAQYAGQTITRQEAEALLSTRVAPIETEINQSVIVPLTQNQFDALVSLTYNIGQEAFRESTLLQLLNQGEYVSAADQFMRWDHENGVENANLKARRAKEAALFQQD